MNLSVVIPTYNEEKQIEACLGSIRNAFSGEVLVADGGSTDDTRSACVALGTRVECFARGVANQCNGAAKEASGDTLLFVSADCRLPNGWYESLENTLKTPYVVAGGFKLSFDEESFAYQVIAFGGNFRSRFLKLALSDQGLFVRKKAYIECGGMDATSLIPFAKLCFDLRSAGAFRLANLSVKASNREWRQNGFFRTTWEHMRIYHRFKHNELRARKRK